MIAAGKAQTATKGLHVNPIDPSIIQAMDAVYIVPIIQKEATNAKKKPRCWGEKSSAVIVKTEGIDPPTPIPDITRQTMIHGSVGASADRAPNTALIAIDPTKHNFLPIRSLNKPQIKPPMSIPTNREADMTPFCHCVALSSGRI